MATTTTNSTVLDLTLDNGKVIPLRSIESKAGNTFYATLAKKADGSRYFSKYGVNVSSAIVGDSLPKAFTFQGEQGKFERGKSTKGKSQVKARLTLKFQGQPKVLDIRITDLGEGTYNLSASLHGVSGGARQVLDEL